MFLGSNVVKNVSYRAQYALPTQKEVECDESCTFAISADIAATLNADPNRTSTFPAGVCMTVWVRGRAHACM